VRWEVGALDNMKSRTGRLVALVAVTIAGTLVGLPLRGQQPQPTVVVYKSASCGCCKNWVDHLRKNGFEVKTQDVEDLAAVKATYGVPSQVSSCHTALVGGYVVE